MASSRNANETIKLAKKARLNGNLSEALELCRLAESKCETQADKANVALEFAHTARNAQDPDLIEAKINIEELTRFDLVEGYILLASALQRRGHVQNLDVQVSRRVSIADGDITVFDHLNNAESLLRKFSGSKSDTLHQLALTATNKRVLYLAKLIYADRAQAYWSINDLENSELNLQELKDISEDDAEFMGRFHHQSALNALRRGDSDADYREADLAFSQFMACGDLTWAAKALQILAFHVRYVKKAQALLENVKARYVTRKFKEFVWSSDLIAIRSDIEIALAERMLLDGDILQAICHLERIQTPIESKMEARLIIARYSINADRSYALAGALLKFSSENISQLDMGNVEHRLLIIRIAECFASLSPEYSHHAEGFMEFFRSVQPEIPESSLFELTHDKRLEAFYILAEAEIRIISRQKVDAEKVEKAYNVFIAREMTWMAIRCSRLLYQVTASRLWANTASELANRFSNPWLLTFTSFEKRNGITPEVAETLQLFESLTPCERQIALWYLDPEEYSESEIATILFGMDANGKPQKLTSVRFHLQGVRNKFFPNLRRIGRCLKALDAGLVCRKDKTDEQNDEVA